MHGASADEHAPDSITVVIPHQLREQVGGNRSVRMDPGTVRDIVRTLEERYPGMTFRLCYETGEIRPFVNVFVASENIKYLQGLDTPVAPGTTVHIVHSVAGGWR